MKGFFGDTLIINVPIRAPDAIEIAKKALPIITHPSLIKNICNRVSIPKTPVIDTAGTKCFTFLNPFFCNVYDIKENTASDINPVIKKTCKPFK